MHDSLRCKRAKQVENLPFTNNGAISIFQLFFVRVHGFILIHPTHSDDVGNVIQLRKRHEAESN